MASGVAGDYGPGKKGNCETDTETGFGFAGGAYCRADGERQVGAGAWPCPSALLRHRHPLPNSHASLSRPAGVHRAADRRGGSARATSPLWSCRRCRGVFRRTLGGGWKGSHRSSRRRRASCRILIGGNGLYFEARPRGSLPYRRSGRSPDTGGALCETAPELYARVGALIRRRRRAAGFSRTRSAGVGAGGV